MILHNTQIWWLLWIESFALQVRLKLASPSKLKKVDKWLQVWCYKRFTLVSVSSHWCLFCACIISVCNFACCFDPHRRAIKNSADLIINRVSTNWPHFFMLLTSKRFPLLIPFSVLNKMVSDTTLISFLQDAMELMISRKDELDSGVVGHRR